MKEYDKFEEMNLKSKTLSALKEGGFTKPTRVQKETIHLVLRGKDVIVQARTGSGKTLCFVAPIFEGIEGGKGVEAIVMVPTRELAQQVETEARLFAKHYGLKTVAIYGGASIGRQITKLKNASFVAGTPGRVMDLMRRGVLKLDSIKFFVLDEGDRMLDMGFLPDIKWILSRTSDDKQTMIYSATVPSPIVRLGKKYMKNPDILKLSKDDISAKGVSQFFVRVGKMNKLAYLSSLLEHDSGKYLIFCNTRVWTQTLADKLRRLGYKAHAMHGDMSQNARTKTMNDFKSGKINILVSTDVSARGIDVENITHVINYDVPRYHKDYVHRIGRTGRLDKSGKAITFVSKDEMNFLDEIEDFVDRRLEEMKIEKKGKLKLREDYEEHANIFGMVPFRFSLKDEVSKWDIVRNLNKRGIRNDEVGQIILEEEGGMVEIVKSKARLLSNVDYFDNIELEERDAREI